MKIVPKCLQFQSRNKKPAAYTSDGFMLPCCWLDVPEQISSFHNFGLKDEELKLSNNKSLIQIFTSNKWENFFNVIINEPNLAPYVCKYKCGEEDI